MAVAAYATLRSLSHVLNNLQHPARLRCLHVDIKQIQSLQEKVQFLLDFLEAHSQRISEEIGDLGRQIADAAAEAEEVVDRHVVDQLRDRSQEETHCVAALSSFCQDTEKVIVKIDTLAKELTMMVKEKSGDIQEEQQIVSVPVRSAEVHLSSGKKSTMVGFDEHLERIVDELTRGEPDLQILPIVGMGGIVVIGGLLANSNMKREYWESVAENVNAFRNSKDYERCLQILSLSYNSLPIHLKPCFLYMRAFPEDYKVPVSELTKLWIAQGFLKPIRGKTLEEAAIKYLRELIDRNLFLSLKFGYDGSITNCGIHDLLRDLCLREYEKQHFMYAPKVQCVRVGGKKQDKCFVCDLRTALEKIDLNEVHDASQLTTIASVLVCTACRNMYPSLHKATLVRVRLLSKRKHSSQESCEEEILHPTSLRYLEVTNFSDLEFLSPSAIALLWNLETFSFFRTILLPSEIWADNLPLKELTLPTSLKELCLEGTVLPSKKARTIGSALPNLETLKLSLYNAYKGNGWDQFEGEFPRLKVLEISRSGLKTWNIENIHFPNLETSF
ncbi:UNVERIFIED_CONTAM: putative disease resistance protein [Sesamum calycinum]|uniref:Disease resistance protein n=1 Tax=Sesamum calycinum TaxID=2727403 RepID=A0AAW2NFA9_9LAMI